MNILVNCSNLKTGGGIQVADSVCCQLYRYEKHQFVVVLSSFMKGTGARIAGVGNVVSFYYDIRNNASTIILGRGSYLDRLVEEYQVQVVLTVFGPSRWNPRVAHLSGFAMPHLVIPESPFFKRMGVLNQCLWKTKSTLLTYFFRRSTCFFWTENPYISERFSALVKGTGGSKKHGIVYTISNNYNQVFDMPDAWKSHSLPAFDGTTCLSVSSFYPHKNFPILVEIARILECKYPKFKFRFVLTFDVGQMGVPDDLKQHFLFIGKVDVSECPDLYRQANVMVMPTLLECFTATYPEAMRMERPIVTTDLEFARGLCGNAACYYSAVDAEACADAIYKVATDKEYAAQLVANGKEQLKKYDNYEQRADKLIGILEEMMSHR